MLTSTNNLHMLILCKTLCSYNLLRLHMYIHMHAQILGKNIHKLIIYIYIIAACCILFNYNLLIFADKNSPYTEDIEKQR